MEIDPSTSSRQAGSGQVDWLKILAVVLGLVVLVGISYLVLWLKADTEPSGIGPMVQNGTSTVAGDISGWKTYRRWFYEFELKYPSNWKIIDKYGDFLHYTDLKYKKGKISGFGIAFGPNETQPKVLAEVFYIRNDENLVSAYKNLTDIDLGKANGERLNINGQEGYLYRNNETLGFSNDEFFVVSKTRNIVYGLKRFGDEETFQKVIASFRLIDKYPDISGWQTYKNNEFGFEIKYPPSLGELEETKTTSSLNVYFAEPVAEEEYIQEGRRHGFGIEIYKTGFTNLNDWFAATFQGDPLWFLDTRSDDGKPIYFAGYPAADLLSGAGFGGPCEGSIVLIRSGYLYELNTCLGKGESYSRVGETFKFIEPK